MRDEQSQLFKGVTYHDYKTLTNCSSQVDYIALRFCPYSHIHFRNEGEVFGVCVHFGPVDLLLFARSLDAQFHGVSSRII